MFPYCSHDRKPSFWASAKLLILWWPGTGSNRRRRPFQRQPMRLFNDLQHREDGQTTRKSCKVVRIVGWVVDREAAG